MCVRVLLWPLASLWSFWRRGVHEVTVATIKKVLSPDWLALCKVMQPITRDRWSRAVTVEIVLVCLNCKICTSCTRAMELPLSNPTALLRANAGTPIKRSPPGVMREPPLQTLRILMDCTVCLNHQNYLWWWLKVSAMVLKNAHLVLGMKSTAKCSVGILNIQESSIFPVQSG